MGHAETVYWVRWLDSANINRGEWTDLDDDGIEAVECVSVGFKVKETERALIFAQSLDEEERGSGVFAIPRATILEMKAWAPAETVT